MLNELTMPAADAIRADAVRFRQLVASDPAQARTAALAWDLGAHLAYGAGTGTTFWLQARIA